MGEVECSDLDLTKVSTIYDLQKRSEEKIAGVMESAIKKAQKSYKADIFGFGEAIHRSNPKAWKSLKQNWDNEYFPELPVTIKVDFKIRRLGTTGSSFLNEIKK
ncbi:Spore germination protein A3 precursor [compost metagenome]